jgi:hypothetical protein
MHAPDDIIDFGEAEIRGRVEKMTLWSIPEPGAETADDAGGEGDQKAAPTPA